MATTGMDLAKTIVEGIIKLLQTPAFLIAVCLLLITLGLLNQEAVLGFLKDAVAIVRELK